MIIGETADEFGRERCGDITHSAGVGTGLATEEMKGVLRSRRGKMCHIAFRVGRLGSRTVNFMELSVRFQEKISSRHSSKQFSHPSSTVHDCSRTMDLTHLARTKTSKQLAPPTFILSPNTHPTIQVFTQSTRLNHPKCLQPTRPTPGGKANENKAPTSSKQAGQPTNKAPTSSSNNSADEKAKNLRKDLKFSGIQQRMQRRSVQVRRTRA